MLTAMSNLTQLENVSDSFNASSLCDQTMETGIGRWGITITIGVSFHYIPTRAFRFCCFLLYCVASHSVQGIVSCSL